MFRFFYELEFKGVYEGRFWLMKLDWQNSADVVITGDSRTCCGVSPAKMLQYLSNLRILNFSFDGNGYSREYLDRIHKILDSESNRKIIILGISPRSLTYKTALESHFTDSKRKKKYHSTTILSFFDRFLQFCRPVKFSELVFILFPDKRKSKTYLEYSTDGWMGRCEIPAENFADTINGFRTFFSKHPASPEIINEIIDYVKKWKKMGIEVYAFRPPTTVEMVNMENTYSGFNEKEFTQLFRAAGGKWIDVKQSGYTTYDASHLCPDGAFKFSADLAKKIRNINKIDL